MVEEDRRGPPIWDKKGGPTQRVSQLLRVDEAYMRRALHKLKLHEGLRGSDDVVVFSNGDVVSKVSGDDIGNIVDED